MDRREAELFGGGVDVGVAVPFVLEMLEPLTMLTVRTATRPSMAGYPPSETVW